MGGLEEKTTSVKCTVFSSGESIIYKVHEQTIPDVFFLQVWCLWQRDHQIILFKKIVERRKPVIVVIYPSRFLSGIAKWTCVQAYQQSVGLVANNDHFTNFGP